MTINSLDFFFNRLVRVGYWSIFEEDYSFKIIFFGICNKLFEYLCGLKIIVVNEFFYKW